jgi:hypothetical protein
VYTEPDGTLAYTEPDGTRVLIDLQPVQLEVIRACQFKAKPCGLCGLPKSNRVHTPKKTATCQFKRKNGCSNCGRNKGDPAHFGAPASFNTLVTGPGQAMALTGLLETWRGILTEKLVASHLPRRLGRVFAEIEFTFPDVTRRDQGNFRVVVEKALGDALVEGGWLEDDDWDHYELGAVTKRIQPGESATRIVLLPWPPIEPAQEALAL